MSEHALIAERARTHGAFADVARIVQQLTDIFRFEAALRAGRRQRDLSHTQREALEMIMHKIGRIIAGDPDFRDHWVDIAGYAMLVAGEES